MTDKYQTIKTKTEAVLFKDKGSKFIGLAFPLQTAEEAKDIIEHLKRKYHDARHHCYAYRIGIGPDEIYRANDDGEPNNSAGMPIYNQILSSNLTNVLVIVVRYFGGTKLGVPGLINAYKQATKMSLEQAKIVNKYIYRSLKISFPYKAMNVVMRLVDEYGLKINSQDMQLNCSMELAVRASKFEELRQRLGEHKLISLL